VPANCREKESTSRETKTIGSSWTIYIDHNNRLLAAGGVGRQQQQKKQCEHMTDVRAPSSFLIEFCMTVRSTRYTFINTVSENGSFQSEIFLACNVREKYDYVLHAQLPHRVSILFWTSRERPGEPRTP